MTTPKTAPAQPAQQPTEEPVAYLWQHSETGRTRVVMPDVILTADATWRVVGPLVLAATPKAEPVQQPERVPLTDKEIADVYFVALGSQHLLERDRGTVTRFARAVEEHHGIKPKEQSND